MENLWYSSTVKREPFYIRYSGEEIYALCVDLIHERCRILNNFCVSYFASIL